MNQYLYIVGYTWPEELAWCEAHGGDVGEGSDWFLVNAMSEDEAQDIGDEVVERLMQIAFEERSDRLDGWNPWKRHLWKQCGWGYVTHDPDQLAEMEKVRPSLVIAEGPEPAPIELAAQAMALRWRQREQSPT